MKINKNTQMEVVKTDKIVCNMCGNDIHKNELGYFDDCLSIEKDWGYTSKYDGENHKIDICQHCYDQLLKSLKIKPF